MIDGIPVIDAVVHSYNFAEGNYNGRFGRMIAESIHRSLGRYMPAGTVPEREYYLRDWPIEETARLLFLESDTDIAVHHALPLFAFKDGGASLEKTVAAKQRWPHRFIAYAGVDPMTGNRALDELEQQVEMLQPVGLKLYPNSWVGSEINSWRMDDPEVAFPVFERAQRLGIKVVAIHKAVPLGPAPSDAFRVEDIDRAAIAFPDLAFEIVHGGMAFLDETAWQLARFPNVYVNLEITTALLARKPLLFERAMVALLTRGGVVALEKIFWGTGAMGFHPQPLIERFVREFSVPAREVEEAGIPEMDAKGKRKILATNYARVVGLDLTDRIRQITDDEFARQRAENGGNADFWSTTKAAGRLA